MWTTSKDSLPPGTIMSRHAVSACVGYWPNATLPLHDVGTVHQTIEDEYGDAEGVKFLLDHGADTNVQNRTIEP